MPSSTMIADASSSIAEWARHLRSGRVTGVSSDDPMLFAEETIGRELNRQQNSDQHLALRIITCIVPTECDHGRVLRLLVDQLAQAALYLWPDWYEGAASLVGTADNNESEAVLQEINEFRVHNASLKIDSSWFRDAMHLCLAGQRPITKKHGLTTQVRQLAKCLGGSELCIVVVALEISDAMGATMSLAKGCEWLAKEAEAKILLVVPAGTETATDLSAIPFFATAPLHEAAKVVPQTEKEHPPAPLNHTQPDRLPIRSSGGLCEQKFLVQPLIGRPHPGSPGEQILAAALSKDEELSGLFQFNLPIRTTRGTRYLVDLIWVDGRVVVEVDGFRHHSSRLSFTADRRRDYELLISDFAVLRLPHDDVVDDPGIAVEKIRDVVRWKKSLRSNFDAE
jgi:very-short-patch-repair endonuclease